MRHHACASGAPALDGTIHAEKIMTAENRIVAGRQMETDRPAERRGGLRVPHTRPAKIFDPALGRYLPGRTEEVGSGGLRIEVSAGALLRPGSMVEVYVAGDEATQPLVSRSHMRPAKVVWVDRAARAGNGRMLIGVELVAAAVARVTAA